jgi:hypothetical protein
MKWQKLNHQKTYDSGDSLVVTHLTTNPPVDFLSTVDRTGNSVLSLLWSYVLDFEMQWLYAFELWNVRLSPACSLLAATQKTFRFHLHSPWGIAEDTLPMLGCWCLWKEKCVHKFDLSVSLLTSAVPSLPLKETWPRPEFCKVYARSGIVLVEA